MYFQQHISPFMKCLIVLEAEANVIKLKWNDMYLLSDLVF